MKNEENFSKIRNSKFKRNENRSEMSSDAVMGMEMTAKVWTFSSFLKRLMRMLRLCHHGEMSETRMLKNGKMSCWWKICAMDEKW